jgi:hypothetical protein
MLQIVQKGFRIASCLFPGIQARRRTSEKMDERAEC